MKKSFKALTGGLMAGGMLLSGLFAIPGQAEAANVSAKFGQTVNVPNQETVINKIIRAGKSLDGRAQYSHNYRPGKYMDCSQFMYYIFQKNGINIHTRDDDRQVKLGSYVPKSKIKKGDLIFYSTKRNKSDITHVSMYIGNGKVLHMANTKVDVTISNLNSSWHQENYVTARRVIK
ncbi:C40 family peptidase [Aneurinibacillus migulanus]|uniref:C40 family peptidase n=1 Tax=Aneurinibacillus migulanus TaxID=47500 RepID=UPI000697D3A4|nr:C40 family peptidase [Aneurinibacillus migulanus]CEH31653.1 NlpC/P60 family protein [Aneurinibacillus migulanus]